MRFSFGFVVARRGVKAYERRLRAFGVSVPIKTARGLWAEAPRGGSHTRRHGESCSVGTTENLVASMAGFGGMWLDKEPKSAVGCSQREASSAAVKSL